MGDDKKGKGKIKKKSAKSQKNETVSKEQVELIKAQLARTLADYENLEKRVERERELHSTQATVRMIVSLLPAFDMLYDAQGHLNDQGLAITIQTLEASLSDQGVAKINPEAGEEFDAEVHEAIDTSQSEELEDGQIISTSLVGWRIRDGVVIRHAKVVVNKK